jgi:hypothetical protein
MTSNIKLETSKFPKMISDLVHSNQFLKIFAIISSGITVISLLTVFVSLTRPPVILTLTPSAQVLDSAQLPNPEDEVRAAILRYIELRYKWDPTNVKTQLKLAEAFIGSNSLRAFDSAAVNVVKFSVEKQVSQKVFPGKPVVKLETKKAEVLGDRISVVQGLHAAGNLKLELGFEYGPRTQQNPWGIYVTKEVEN